MLKIIVMSEVSHLGIRRFYFFEGGPKCPGTRSEERVFPGDLQTASPVNDPGAGAGSAASEVGVEFDQKSKQSADKDQSNNHQAKFCRKTTFSDEDPIGNKPAITAFWPRASTSQSPR